MRIKYRIFLATFSLAFVTLFIIHLVALPFYWANASSQQGRPIDLYSPNVWTPGIILCSAYFAVFVTLSFELCSSLRKGEANEATIFITTFCLGGIGLGLFAGLLGLRWGHKMSLTSLGRNPKNEYAMIIGTFLFSFIGAVFSTVVFEVYKLARWLRKRLK